MEPSETKSYTVEGMSCEHCRSAVQEEVGEVDGVESVEVDLESGRLQVNGLRVTDEAVAAAVEEAGYRLAGRP